MNVCVFTTVAMAMPSTPKAHQSCRQYASFHPNPVIFIALFRSLNNSRNHLSAFVSFDNTEIHYLKVSRHND
jgi:hypothetical protein